MTMSRATLRIDARRERIELASRYLAQLASEPASAVLDSLERVAAMERMLASRSRAG